MCFLRGEVGRDVVEAVMCSEIRFIVLPEDWDGPVETPYPPIGRGKREVPFDAGAAAGVEVDAEGVEDVGAEAGGLAARGAVFNGEVVRTGETDCSTLDGDVVASFDDGVTYLFG